VDCCFPVSVLPSSLQSVGWGRCFMGDNSNTPTESLICRSRSSDLKIFQMEAKFMTLEGIVTCHLNMMKM
jgi:hypothetical protein